MSRETNAAPGAAVRAQWPKLRQVHPMALGGVPGEIAVQIGDPTLRFRAGRGGPEVHVRIGDPDHLDRGRPDSPALHRQLTAWAEYRIPGPDPLPRGGSEWVMNGQMLRTVRTPPAMVVAPDRTDDVSFSESVWTAVGMAIDNAEAALAHLREL
ncbi:hypothetical protein [Streptomyces xiamenensis]|uniref:hypothetical protein n=1 Tax=Streptomyces xiamenensis TaxID=408015 RepID=UPI0037D2321B